MSNTDIKTDLTNIRFWSPQYKTLDHWRGIAVLWVMIFHGFGTAYDQSLHPLAELIKSVAAPGWLGVHLFFCYQRLLYVLSHILYTYFTFHSREE
jgi:peptidoglycan/LPS O-acetylase OafA/YrhL